MKHGEVVLHNAVEVRPASHLHSHCGKLKKAKTLPFHMCLAQRSGKAPKKINSMQKVQISHESMFLGTEKPQTLHTNRYLILVHIHENIYVLGRNCTYFTGPRFVIDEHS